MAERKIPREQLEIEFWDGHHFRDQCKWNDNVRSLVLEERYAQYKRAFDAIKNLERSGQSIAVKTLREGENFCPSDFPVGSILRINYDASYFGGDRRDEVMWGMVDQVRELPWGKEDFDVVLGYAEDKLKVDKAPFVGRRRFFIDPKSPAVIGKVDHFRESGQFAFGLVKFRSALPPLIDIITGQDQSLLRFNSVEAWAYGEAVRRPAVDSKSLMRKQLAHYPL